MPAPELTQALGVSQAQLASHNRGLQPTIWQGSKYLPKGYELRLPADSVSQPLATAFAGLPADVRFDKQLPDMFHTVARGDTLSQIAASYDTRVSTLVALNGLRSSHRIRAGQRLRLPAAGPVPTVASAAPAEPEPAIVAAAAEPEPAIVAAVVEPEPAIVAAVAEPVVEEVTPPTMAGDYASTLIGTIQTAPLSDPSDYSVAADNTIEVQPLETLGHYGDWLEIKTQRLRDINGLAFRSPVEVGQRIKLDLNTVDARRFEERRIAYHRTQQDSFFRQHIISSVTEHTIRRGESIWVLSLREYDVPIWLFRQYNPSLDLHRVRPGTTVQFPVLTDVERG